MSHIVQVVSMLDVIMRLGETVFQSSDVRGAVWSGVFELDNRARGVSFVIEPSRVERVMVLFWLAGVSAGRDHSLR